MKAKLIWVWVCNYVLLPVWQLSVVTLRERERERERRRGTERGEDKEKSDSKRG